MRIKAMMGQAAINHRDKLAATTEPESAVTTNKAGAFSVDVAKSLSTSDGVSLAN